MIILLPRLFKTVRLEWMSLLQNLISYSVSLWQFVFTLLINCPLKSINFLNFYFRRHRMLSYSPYSTSSSPYLFTLLRRLVQTEQVGSISRMLQSSFRLMQQFLHRHTLRMQGHLHESLFCRASRMLSLQMSVRQSKQNFFQHEVAWQPLWHWYTSFPLSLHIWQAPILTKEIVEDLQKGSCLTLRLGFEGSQTTDYFLSLSMASEIYSIMPKLIQISAHSTSCISNHYFSLDGTQIIKKKSTLQGLRILDDFFSQFRPLKTPKRLGLAKFKI